jgi:hypothetical protein
VRKGVPVLADGERHPSTHEGRKGAPVEEVSIYTRARVGGRFWAICGAF